MPRGRTSALRGFVFALVAVISLSALGQLGRSSALAAPAEAPAAVTFTGSLTATDPQQTGRVVRTGSPSACGTLKPNPGINGADSTVPHAYDAYSFPGPSVETCVEVTVTTSGALCNGQVQSVAYLGTFDPANVSTNYVADIAGNGPEVRRYSFTVPAGQAYVVVVNEVTGGGGCPAYTLDVAPAVRTWDGGGADGNWNTAANWVEEVVPPAGAALVFPDGAARQANTNNLPAGTKIASVTFTGGAYTISGTGVELGLGGLAASGGVHAFEPPVALPGDRTVSITAGELTLDGAVTGTGGLTKTGVGTLAFRGPAANTYEGTTTVQAGTLRLNRTPADGSIRGPLIIGDGIGAAGEALVEVLGANGQIVNTVTVTVNGDGELRAPVAEQFASLIVNGGLVSQPGGGGLTVTTALTMTGGMITSTAGTELDLGANATTNEALTPASISGVLDLTGATRTFTVADGASAIDLDIAAVVSSAGGITKAGPGVLRLGGQNSYTGLTTISAGTLQVDGVVGDVVVNGGALGGAGTTGAVTFLAAGGTLAPGASPGVLTTGPMTMSAQTTLRIELDGTSPGGGHDQLVVSGALAIGNAILQVVPGARLSRGDRFTIARATGGITGTFSGLPQGATFNAGTRSFVINYSANEIVLTDLGLIGSNLRMPAIFRDNPGSS